MDQTNFLREQAERQTANRQAQIVVAAHLFPLWRKVADAETAACRFNFGLCRSYLELAQRDLDAALLALEKHDPAIVAAKR